MKRKIPLLVALLVGAVVLTPTSAQATASAIVTPGDCSEPEFTYEVTTTAGGLAFTLDDGTPYTGSKADTVTVWADSETVEGSWEPPSAATEIQAAREVTLSITNGSTTTYDSASFDFRSCFTYAARDDFTDPESSKTVRMGNDTVGSSVTGNANRIRLTRWVAPPGMTSATSCSAYLDRTNSGSDFAADCVIYTDSSGVPGSLVTNGSVTLSSNLQLSSPQWYPNTFATAPTITPGNLYWIGVHTAKQSIHYRTDNSATSQGARRGDSTYGTPPSSWSSVTNDSSEAREYAVYLSYTDDGTFATSGNTTGNRGADAGGSWQGWGRSSTRGLTWAQDEIDATEGALAASRSKEQVGFATLDANTADEYTVSSLVEMSPTTWHAAPGVTAAFVNAGLNVFFKAEVTTAGSNWHRNGALAGGITAAGEIHSGAESGCLKNNIGLEEGELYWLHVVRDGDVFTAKIFENRGTYGYNPLSDHIAKCTVDLDEHLTANDPVICDDEGDDPGSGSLPCTDTFYLDSGMKTSLDTAELVGVRSKIQVTPGDHASQSEDDGLSRWLEFYAYDTTGSC